jgi:hypothetical protein
MGKTIEFPQSSEYHIKQLQILTDKISDKLSNGDGKNHKIDWDKFKYFDRNQKIHFLDRIYASLDEAINSFQQMQSLILKAREKI